MPFGFVQFPSLFVLNALINFYTKPIFSMHLLFRNKGFIRDCLFNKGYFGMRESIHVIFSFLLQVLCFFRHSVNSLFICFNFAKLFVIFLDWKCRHSSFCNLYSITTSLNLSWTPCCGLDCLYTLLMFHFFFPRNESNCF